MYRKPVKSTNIAAIGYDPDDRILEVEFTTKRGNPVYAYRGVTEEEHEDLIFAPSIGKYFAEHIKPKYTGELVS